LQSQQDTGRSRFGHPVGLFWLSGSEFWERFSYYGMQSLLVLYMTHYLLLPANLEQVWGFGPFRWALERLYGPLEGQPLGSAIFGFYSGFVYLTPILGGIVADRWLGRTATVTLGALLMVAGHFLMAFPPFFLFALCCLLIGVGGFKGNIAAQVGELYKPDDLRRPTAFQIYFMAIQVAVIAAPMICGGLGELVGWHWGFGAAGVGMVAGVIIYRIGRPTYRIEAQQAVEDGPAPSSAKNGNSTRAVLLLVALIPVLAIGAVGNQQIFNAYLLFGERHFELSLFGQALPVTSLVTLDAITSSITIPLSLVFWRWWARRRREPDDITKIIIGMILSVGGALSLALAALFAGTGKVSLGFAVMFEVFNDFGFANVFPVGLALYSRVAPPRFTGVMVAAYYLHMFICNMLVGYIGGFLETLPGPTFWLIHAGLIGASAIILIGVQRGAGHILRSNEA